MIIFLSLFLWFFGSFLGSTAVAAPVDFPKRRLRLLLTMVPAEEGTSLLGGLRTR